MPIQDQAGVRPLETSDDWIETRLEALGYIFHGTIPLPESKRGAAKAGSNLLHFARCPKLDKVGETEARVWFRTISIAKQQLDEMVGDEAHAEHRIDDRQGRAGPQRMRSVARE